MLAVTLAFKLSNKYPRNRAYTQGIVESYKLAFLLLKTDKHQGTKLNI